MAAGGTTAVIRGAAAGSYVTCIETAMPAIGPSSQAENPASG